MGQQENAKRCSIAHLDDDAIVHFLTEKVITISSDKVDYSAFTSGYDLLPKIATGAIQFDALIVDLDMPGMSGWTFLDELRKVSNKKPVYILTSSDNQRDRLKANEYEFVVDYFLKPLTPIHVSQICSFEKNSGVRIHLK